MMWTREKLIKKYIEFFKSKNHKEIPNAPLVPKDEASVLFTTAGMHPLIPYLLGQSHPLGKRLCNVQKCLRTTDIEKVGDAFHLTFFEMLGNWSLGDYWKKQAIEWSFEFLTKVLGIEKEKLCVTCFSGDKSEGLPKDEESAKIWQELGIEKERIFFLGKEHNWWGPISDTGPCGPCTEMFIDTGKPKCSENCKPGCNCGKYLEIWNDVFMEYNKTKEGYEKLKQKNVDTGMGVERTLAILNNKESVYEVSPLKEIKEKVEEVLGLKNKREERIVRIISDHLRASCFILAEDVTPSNLGRGYVLRRLIRRCVRLAKLKGYDFKEKFCSKIARKVIEVSGYKHLKEKEQFILEQLDKEEERFLKNLEKGLKVFDTIIDKLKKQGKNEINGKEAFLLYQSYGFPLELTLELAKEKGFDVNVKEFNEEVKKHQELSRKATKGLFKSGLASHDREAIKLHTATHLLHAALREVLGKEVQQKGSHITPERLRFDFSFDRKLTQE
ncbi:MAG TPA: alanine--tRNA ligase, partial [Candidatus Pacearchaeota archaeon]|nr:alanine--tRNA ligase [Candidatus Pacearchaeota archaeon]